jgi:hypothetical protein
MSTNAAQQQQPQQPADAAAASSTSNVPVKQECLIPSKDLWVLWRTNFEIDQHYIPMKVIRFVFLVAAYSLVLPPGRPVTIPSMQLWHSCCMQLLPL